MLRITISAYPHLHSTPPLGGFPSDYCYVEKLEFCGGCGYPMVKKIRIYLYSFWHDPRTWRTHTHTHRHRMTAYMPRLCIASRGKSRDCQQISGPSLLQGSNVPSTVARLCSRLCRPTTRDTLMSLCHAAVDLALIIDDYKCKYTQKCNNILSLLIIDSTG